MGYPAAGEYERPYDAEKYRERPEFLHLYASIELLREAKRQLAAVSTQFKQIIAEERTGISIKFDLLNAFNAVLEELRKTILQLEESKQIAPKVESLARVLFAKLKLYELRLLKLAEDDLIKTLGHSTNYTTIIQLIKDEAETIRKTHSQITADASFTNFLSYKSVAERSQPRISSYVNDIYLILIDPAVKIFEVAEKLNVPLPSFANSPFQATNEKSALHDVKVEEQSAIPGNEIVIPKPSNEIIVPTDDIPNATNTANLQNEDEIFPPTDKMPELRQKKRLFKLPFFR